MENILADLVLLGDYCSACRLCWGNGTGQREQDRRLLVYGLSLHHNNLHCRSLSFCGSQNMVCLESKRCRRTCLDGVGLGLGLWLVVARRVCSGYGVVISYGVYCSRAGIARLSPVSRIAFLFMKPMSTDQRYAKGYPALIMEEEGTLP